MPLCIFSTIPTPFPLLLFFLFTYALQILLNSSLKSLQIVVFFPSGFEDKNRPPNGFWLYFWLNLHITALLIRWLLSSEGR